MRLAIALAGLLLASCGYKVSGKGDLVPSTVKTIAVPAFGNITTRYKLTDRLPEAISREFITRTRYRVVPGDSGADAVLSGNVVSYSAYPTLVDPIRNRAAAVEILVMLQVTLTERSTGKVLLSRPAIEVRERYQISADPTLYYDESEDALNRASRQVARQVVSAILESF